MVWAILCTVLCCLPLGIVAILKSTSVERLWAQGQHEAAIKAAQDAKKFSIIGAIVSVVLVALYMMFVFVVAIASA
ncbi:MAG: CD225/dispanin family protein [Bacteroides sp.]|nr:CD225/dispanin family protein [Bacteroides sp.]